MNKSDIIEAIFQNSQYKRLEVEDIVNQVFEQIITGLIEDGKVTINNFGTFEKVDVNSYYGVHPQTGERIKIALHQRINFISSKKLKTLIKK